MKAIKVKTLRTAYRDYLNRKGMNFDNLVWRRIKKDYNNTARPLRSDFTIYEN